MKKQKNTTKKFLLILLIILIIFCSYLLIKIIQRQNNPLNREVKIEKTSQNQTINTNDVTSQEKAKDHPGKGNKTFHIHRSPRYPGKSQDCGQIPCRRRQGESRSAFQRQRAGLCVKGNGCNERLCRGRI